MSQILKTLRIEKGWSQEQLAEIAGISARTVQRIESGETCSLDTAQAFAAAFDTSPEIFLKGDEETTTTDDNSEKDLLNRIHLEQKIRRRLKFYWHLAIYLAVNTLLLVINLTTSPQHFWFIYPLMGWGIGLAAHAMKTFGFDIEGRMVQKMMEKE